MPRGKAVGETFGLTVIGSLVWMELRLAGIPEIEKERSPRRFANHGKGDALIFIGQLRIPPQGKIGAGAIASTEVRGRADKQRIGFIKIGSCPEVFGVLRD